MKKKKKRKAGSVLSLSVLLRVPAPAALVGELVAFSRRRLVQEGSEGGADGAATERLLHAEVVHHALLHFLLRRGKKEAAKDGQLQNVETRGSSKECRLLNRFLCSFLILS